MEVPAVDLAAAVGQLGRRQLSGVDPGPLAPQSLGSCRILCHSLARFVPSHRAVLWAQAAKQQLCP